MRARLARLKSIVRTPLLAGALLAVFGTSAVHALCPDEMSAEYPTYTLKCTLLVEINGTCLMECVQIEKAPKERTSF